MGGDVTQAIFLAPRFFCSSFFAFSKKAEPSNTCLVVSLLKIFCSKANKDVPSLFVMTDHAGK